MEGYRAQDDCPRCGTGPCQQAEGPCPRYPDAEPFGLTGDAGEVERLRRQLAGAVEENAELQREVARLRGQIAAATAEGYADGLHDGRHERGGR